MTALWEGTVSNTFDEVLFVLDKKELALHPDRRGRAKLRFCRRKRLRDNLFGFDQCHDGSSRHACIASQPASGAALASRTIMKFAPRAEIVRGGSSAKRQRRDRA